MTGIIIVNKPEGWTSHDIVAKLRRILGERKIGHGGTLDPMATGVLPVFVGRATRAVEFMENADKEYVAALRLGISTDTQDTTGRTLEERVVIGTNAYLCAYVVILVVSFLLVSIDGFSVMTNFSAVIACFNNIGPGFEAVGPLCNFSLYSPFSKLILIVDMLAGRLEIFPILVLFSLQTWKRSR